VITIVLGPNSGADQAASGRLVSDGTNGMKTMTIVVVLTAAALSRAIGSEPGAIPQLPVSAAAGTVPVQATSDEMEVVAVPVPKVADPTVVPGVAQCVSSPKCWKVLKEGFQKISGTFQGEIEGAMPNRFFPQTEIWVLERPDSSGNFLKVYCGPLRQLCADKRDELQWRLMVASFLKAAPGKMDANDLYDPITWKPTALGSQIFAQARRARPTLTAELAALLGGR
jgi:hypothetical protein